MNKHKIIDLTAAQAKAWNDTRAALVWHCPAFSHIFYTMMSKDSGQHLAIFTDEVPIAATDGSHILLNPEPFFKHTLQERIFIVAHEVLHGVFGHMELMHSLSRRGKVSYQDGTELDYDQNTMNQAMDYVINDMLIESNIGQYNTNWLHDKVKGVHTDSALTVYRRIYQPNGGGGGGGGGNSSQSGFDQHMPPGSSQGKDPAQAASDRSPQAWKSAVAAASAAAKAQGKLSSALERAFQSVLEPVVDWTDKVRAFFARKPGGGTYDWRKPDRRLITRGIIAPGRTGFGAGPIVVGIDTSGSITQAILDRFFGEMHGILDDIRPVAIHLMFCDASVHRVDEIEDMSDLLSARAKGAGGGGGTAFEPVFSKIDELGIEPEALIYLTDGMGSFPAEAPAYPVLWGSIHPASKYPWGEVVDIPVK